MTNFFLQGSEGMVLTSAGPIQHRELAQQQAPQAAQLALQQFQQQQQALEDRHKSTGASLNFGGKGPQLAPSQTTTSLFDTKVPGEIFSCFFASVQYGRLGSWIVCLSQFGASIFCKQL